MFDMTIWNRVQYPSKKNVLFNVRDTFFTTILVGICSATTITIATKIVSFCVA